MSQEVIAYISDSKTVVKYLTETLVEQITSYISNSTYTGSIIGEIDRVPLASLPPRLRWERDLVDPQDVHTLQEILKSTDEGFRTTKQSGGVDVSILTAGCFKRAEYRTGGTFDADIFATYFLEKTDYSPMGIASAEPQSVQFLDSVRQRGGARVAIFLRSEIEFEQQAAHDMLLAEGLVDRPYLPGTHINIAIVDKRREPGYEKELAAYLFSLLSCNFRFLPVRQRVFPPNNQTSYLIPLSPAPILSHHELDYTMSMTS